MEQGGFGLLEQAATALAMLVAGNATAQQSIYNYMPESTLRDPQLTVCHWGLPLSVGQVGGWCGVCHTTFGLWSSVTVDRRHT